MLEAYLEGFMFARKDDSDVNDYQFLSRFNDWVRNRYHVKDEQGWAKIISYYSADESEEIGLFWDLLDKFTQKNKVNGHGSQLHKK